MRVYKGLVLTVLTGTFVFLLDHSFTSVPAFGKFLDPARGFWANAEPADKSFNQDIKVPGLKDGAQVWFDDRLVPHVTTTNNYDLYYVQGYLHASFRLFQMEMQARAASGRVSEVIGAKGIEFDVKQRRKGMVFGAENSLKQMESDPRTKEMLDAYTAGINAYINQLSYTNYPLEYKLIGFEPEPWTNLKSALMLKLMADDLTGSVDDIPLTYLREHLAQDVFELLFPEKIPGSASVIPKGTAFQPASLKAPPIPADTVFPKFTRKDFKELKEEGVGSNNWVVGGQRTYSGNPILCNDPHLGLNLPSLWYEVQLRCPGLNVYGVSLPGAPGVIIGFNDSVSWGFTNNYRDVKDYFLIKQNPDDAESYMLDGASKKYTIRYEEIKVRGKAPVIDTVKYTVHGPITFDGHHPADGGLDKPLAMCWMAHRPSNELLAVYLMNRATNYETFYDGIQHFFCPAQNMIFADHSGTIALHGQGQFINKWQGQGKYIMDGSKSSALWGDEIPTRENPRVVNPAQGYLASANECVTDSTYPYWYNGGFVEFRAWRINQVLSGLNKATINDMFALQNDNHSLLAERALPIMLGQVDSNLSAEQQATVQQFKKWNCNLDANSVEASMFQIWWYDLYHRIWNEFQGLPGNLYPLPERTLQLMEQYQSGTLKLKEFDNFKSHVGLSFNAMTDSIKRIGKENAAWYKLKNTSITHLTRQKAFSITGLETGGWGNTPNAMKGGHGPSWRMVVEMGKEVSAFGVYPGGQSGNPGSRYFANFIPKWAEGNYYKLNFYSGAPPANQVKYQWNMHK